MFGTPVSESQWRTINLVAAVSLLLLAVLPIAVLPLWKRPRMRVLLGLCWVLAVGFVMHGVIDDLQRVLSLTGLLHLDYPFFATVDRRAADIQDLLFNETWFSDRRRSVGNPRVGWALARCEAADGGSALRAPR